MTPDESPSNDLDRYARQMRYAPIGDEGQRRLLAARALVCGCGALGSVIANTLARGGVGYLRIVDRDFLEINNLQRQVLFDEEDVAAGLPKAIAAAAKLRKDQFADHDRADRDRRRSHERAGADRGRRRHRRWHRQFRNAHALNDVSLKRGIPWVYGGCLGAEGQTMTILPGETACLRCLMNETPPPGTTPTCDTAGILAPIVNVIASLAGQRGDQDPQRQSPGDQPLADGDRHVGQPHPPGESGIAAGRRAIARPATSGEFPWLAGQRASHSAILCGRNAVQLSPPERRQVSLRRAGRQSWQAWAA